MSRDDRTILHEKLVPSLCRLQIRHLAINFRRKQTEYWLTHDVGIEVYANHAVHDLVQFCHHWFRNLWDGICSNSGLWKFALDSAGDISNHESRT